MLVPLFAFPYLVPKNRKNANGRNTVFLLGHFSYTFPKLRPAFGEV
jgi:hypothetical protein